MAEIELPAICNRCAKASSSGIIVSDPFRPGGPGFDALRATLPIICPRCGGYAWTFSGGLAFFEDITPILRQPGVTQEDLRELIEVLRQLVETENLNEVAATIDGQAPKFRGINRFLPHDQANVLAFLSLVVVTATLLVDVYFKIEEHTRTPALTSTPTPPTSDESASITAFMGLWIFPYEQPLVPEPGTYEVKRSRFEILPGSVAQGTLHYSAPPYGRRPEVVAEVMFSSQRGTRLMGTVHRVFPPDTPLFAEGKSVTVTLIETGPRLWFSVPWWSVPRFSLPLGSEADRGEWKSRVWILSRY